MLPIVYLVAACAAVTMGTPLKFLSTNKSLSSETMKSALAANAVHRLAQEGPQPDGSCLHYKYDDAHIRTYDASKRLRAVKGQLQ